jgi:DNA polymerase-3 subunit delta'
MVMRLEHPDVHWYFPLPRPKKAGSPEKMADALEAARFARLDEIRKAPLQAPTAEAATGIYLAAARSLRKRAQSRPSMAERQVFVIGDAETLVPQEASPEAANALLKLLEEPPRDTRFILTSSAPGSLLDTIRSRTVPLLVRPLPEDEVVGFLLEADVDPEQARVAARLGGGAIGRALGFLPVGDDQGPLEKERRDAFTLLQAALGDGPGAGFTAGLAQGVSKARALLGLLEALELWLRDLAAVAADRPDLVVNADAVPWMTRRANAAAIHPEAVARTLARLDEAALQARGNVNPQLLVAGLVTDLQKILAPPPIVENRPHVR